MRSTVSVYVDVDVNEVLEDLSVDDLVAHLRAREVDAQKPKPGGFLKDDLYRVLELLQQGRAQDAELELERLLEPKWKTSVDAGLAYAKALGRAQ